METITKKVDTCRAIQQRPPPAGALARPYCQARRRPRPCGGPRALFEARIRRSRSSPNYEKASGNKIEHSIIPFAPLRQKEVSAITSGVVPDVMEVADYLFPALNAWED